MNSILTLHRTVDKNEINILHCSIPKKRFCVSCRYR